MAVFCPEISLKMTFPAVFMGREEMRPYQSPKTTKRAFLTKRAAP